jgi:hypothetical protein
MLNMVASVRIFHTSLSLFCFIRSCERPMTRSGGRERIPRSAPLLAMALLWA